jgi:hypothetical protein
MATHRNRAEGWDKNKIRARRRMTNKEILSRINVNGRKRREADIQTAVRRYLELLGPRCYYIWHRMDVAHTCEEGTPDFVGWIDGIPFGLEIKKPGAKTSKSRKAKQAEHLARISRAGGYPAIVHSFDEAKSFFDSL